MTELETLQEVLTLIRSIRIASWCMVALILIGTTWNILKKEANKELDILKPGEKFPEGWQDLDKIRPKYNTYIEIMHRHDTKIADMRLHFKDQNLNKYSHFRYLNF